MWSKNRCMCMTMQTSYIKKPRKIGIVMGTSTFNGHYSSMKDKLPPRILLSPCWYIMLWARGQILPLEKDLDGILLDTWMACVIITHHVDISLRNIRWLSLYKMPNFASWKFGDQFTYVLHLGLYLLIVKLSKA